MSYVTEFVIGFAFVEVEELRKYIKDFLKIKKREFDYEGFSRENDIKKLGTGTRGPIYVVIAGGLNYFSPELIEELCEYLYEKYNIPSFGVVKREDENPQIIRYDYERAAKKRKWIRAMKRAKGDVKLAMAYYCHDLC